jgi:hypothetical protein
VAAAGRYGEILQRLCAAAEAPIMNAAFTQAAQLAQEFGGIAKPTGSGGGEIGVGLFATPEAAGRFRKACAEPLQALEGDLDTLGVRCEFPDNTVGRDLDERDSAEIPAPEPEELAMPTLVTGPPTGLTPPPTGEPAPQIQEDAQEPATERTPPPQEPVEQEPVAQPKPPPRRLLVGLLLFLGLALLGGLAAQRWWPAAPPSPPPRADDRPSQRPVAAPDPTAVPALEQAREVVPTAAQEAKNQRPADEPAPSANPEPESPPRSKRGHRGRAAGDQAPNPRAGKLSVKDF